MAAGSVTAASLAFVSMTEEFDAIAAHPV